MKDIRQSEEYARYLSQTGWVVEKKNGVYFFIKKFPLIGAFMKVQRPERISYRDIELLSNKYRVFQVIVEPLNTRLDSAKRADRNSPFTGCGFKKASPYLPGKTLELDLTKSENTLFKNLKKDARYALRKTQNSNIKSQNDIENFRNIWRIAVPFKRHVPSEKSLNHLKESFGENCLLITASLPRHGEVTAGAIFLKTKDRAYYWHAFTSKEGRRVLAQYRIVWEGLLWAKKSGCKVFDFEGIYDERFPNKKWLGFTHFKKSLGGRVVEYPGAFSKWRLPL